MIKYVCDRCKKETTNGFDKLSIWFNQRNSITDAVSMDSEITMMLCPECMKQILERFKLFLNSLKNKTYINKKNNTEYNVLYEGIDATNSRDGEEVIIYEREGMIFVRNKLEFYEKFQEKK